MSALWHPTASIEVLHQRAVLIDHIRAFFRERKILEVETPCLSANTITDPYLLALHTLHTPPGSNKARKLFLQTSPEYAMKRLLAAGSGDIFQLCKSFRDDEVGRLHNPEFTMLEWYRLGFSMQALIDETKALLLSVLEVEKVEQASYAQLFEKHLGFNPLNIALEALIDTCKNHDLGDYVSSLQSNIQETDTLQSNILLKDSLLQVLFSLLIEPNIGKVYPIVVTHFPASQASLARLNSDGKTANRFELYYKQIELANGFEELSDAHEQRKRFEQDNKKRQVLGLPRQKIDMHFMAALDAGLPDCSGIALGIDRLLMLALNKNKIEEVMSFSYCNC